MNVFVLSILAFDLPTTLVPTNFWLLRKPGVVSTDEDQLVGNYVASLRAAEELTYSGPRTLLLPGELLSQIEELSYGDGGLGARVWDAAIGLGIWLCSDNVTVRDERVLELGSGVGLGGISAALAGASAVMLTEVAAEEADDDDATEKAELGGNVLLDTLTSNAALNRVDETTTVRSLDWCECMEEKYEPHATYKVVLGADLVHDEKYSLPALCAAVVKHTAPDGAAYLMCAKGRPGVAALPDTLLRCADAERNGASGSGEVELTTVKMEEMCVMNSYGAADMVLVTYCPAGVI